MFNENDIRPESLMQKQKELYLQDIEDLVSQKVFFVETSCPACGSNDKIRKFKKYELDYQECKVCETLYISPRPTLDILEDHYENSKHYRYWNDFIFPQSEHIRREKIFIPRVDTLIRITNELNCDKDIVVEIGAGSGIFCKELKNRNTFKEIIAVEPNPVLAETCRNNGITTIQNMIEGINDLKANVIVGFEVIEHLFSPKEFLNMCFNNLKNNGILMLTCPNIKGFDMSILEDISDEIDAEHLNYFSLYSLSLLLEGVGFKIIETSTPGQLDTDIVKNKIMIGEYLIDETNFIQKLVFNKEVSANFQKFLIDNKLSSNMMIIARKP